VRPPSSEERIVSGVVPETAFVGEPGGLLYHYTSFDGLLGILRSGKLWASSIHHLNDAREITFALDKFAEIVKEEIEREPGRFDKDTLTGLARVIDSLRLVTARVGLQMNIVYEFVATFSEDGDLLSQWRGYCPGYGGVSIGFNPQELRSLGDRHGFDLGPCRYDEAGQTKLLRDLMEQGAVFAHDQPEVGYDGIAPEITRALYGHYNILWPVHPQLLQVAAIIKHPGFKEEKEWRLVSKPGAANSLELDFRASPTTIVPYLSIPLARDEGDTTLPIDKIVVGPGPQQRLTMVSVEKLLWEYGLVQRCKIDKSQTEYRGWR